MDIEAEKQDRFELIEELTPGWLEARARAERSARMDRILCRDERAAFAPIDRLLDEVIDLNLNAERQGGGYVGAT